MLVLFQLSCKGEEPMTIPADFPTFSVPGQETQMLGLREMFWLHNSRNGPGATLWDQWMVSPGMWPALDSTGYSENSHASWKRVLSNRNIDKDGYVSVHQHASIAHPAGWPFPFWNQCKGSVGWHFSFKDTVGPPWRLDHLSKPDDWRLSGAEDLGIDEYGWNVKLTNPNATVTAPAKTINMLNAPFLQLRWRAEGLGDAQPYIEWTTSDQPRFSEQRRFYFDPVQGETIVHDPIPVYKHPEWKGDLTRFRIGFRNATPDAKVTIQALFVQYDTRHDINGQCFIRGCTNCFEWTRDINFLRRNINRMRTAMHFTMSEFDTLNRKYIYNTWVGHDGRSGLKYDEEGNKHILWGHGVGDNYWDLVPFGAKDFYATLLYYESLQCLARMERAVRDNPQWNVPVSESAFDPDMLLKHAAEVKAVANKLFWNPKTGRFIPSIDMDGKIHDYGMTFINTEAIYYDLATPEHAKAILSWLDGDRIVKGDTSTGADIYHWRFAPRSTTKRNIEHYLWSWTAPESIPWGGQVQDGGAVLGFSYHDLMARLTIHGPDNAAQRLTEIMKWFAEVQAAGGYRAYYDGSREGSLQGGGTAGGLGLDREFIESVLVPQVMIDGFMGFKPYSDGFSINPRLPRDWPELKIDRIRFHESVLAIRVTNKEVEITNDVRSDIPTIIRLPKGNWNALASGSGVEKLADGSFKADWRSCKSVKLVRD
jgi:hypothetical protein